MENGMSKELLLQQFANILDLYGDDITRREYDTIPEKPAHSRTLEMRCDGWDSAKREARQKFPKADHEEVHVPILDKVATKAVRLLKKQPMIFETLCDTLEVTPKECRKILNQIQEIHGHFLTQVGEAWAIVDPLASGPTDTQIDIEKLKHGRFGFITDTHFGSKFQQLTYLNDFYERCYKLGVDYMLHAGDLSDGNGSLYRGQRFEMFLHGYKEQRDFTVEQYPKIDGVSTYTILGNHDESFIRTIDINILEEIEQRRPDIEYIGRRGAYIYLVDKSVKTYLQHPDGGLAYAISYKAQKFIEGFASEHKPQVFLIGHYHMTGQFFIRNVHAYLGGCFQSQTPYLRAKGLMPQVGGWIVEFDIASDGWSIEEINSKLIPYYKPIKDDYKNYPR